VYAGFGKPLRLWNPQTGERRSWPAAAPTSNPVPGPGGAAIIFGTADGCIETWDIRAGHRLDRLTLP
jgi:hypothetical protein